MKRDNKYGSVEVRVLGLPGTTTGVEAMNMAEFEIQCASSVFNDVTSIIFNYMWIGSSTLHQLSLKRAELHESARLIPVGSTAVTELTYREFAQVQLGPATFHPQVVQRN